MGLANLDSGEVRDSKPIVEMRNGNVRVLVFLDTGASVSLIGEDLYLKHFSHIRLTDTQENICDIHRQRITVLGSMKLTLQVGGMSVVDEILVARGVNLGGMVLLGHPVCKRNNILICPSKKGIMVERGKDTLFVPYVECGKRGEIEGQSLNDRRRVHLLQEALEANYVAKGTLIENVWLKSGVPQFVRLGVKGVSDECNVIIIEGSEKVEDLTVVVTLNIARKHEIWAEVTYNGAHECRLKKGTYVADVEVFCLPVRVMEEEDGERVWLCEKMDVKESAQRRQALREKLQNADYSDYGERVVELLMEFSDIIALKGDKTGLTDVLQHSILLEPGTRPIYIPAYRIPVKIKDEVEKIVQGWESEGIIRKSSSPFNFPLLAVPKKDGTHRVCVDFRRLNEKTIPDRFPAACMQDLISEIGGRKIYSSIDLLQGFLQVPLEEESRSLTAFSTTKGHYEFCRMPFGLQGSPTTFTRLVNTVFHGLLGRSVHVYMDDVLICSNTIEEHLLILREVLTRLRVAGLKVKLAKCDFVKRKIVYLGHVISEEGVQVNPEKIKAIAKFPEPKSKKNIKQFLGLAGFFRKFVRSFSAIAAPLTDVLKEDVQFRFEEKERNAFQNLKDALGQPPVLRFPNFDLPFIVVTDASDIGMGACLMQKYGNKIHPVAFFSRKWKTASPDETKMSVVDKEAYAVVASLQHFRYIILGYKVVVYTDHKPLIDLFNRPSISSKRARWFTTINDFSPDIKYIEGKSNFVADALSRNIEGGEQEVCMVDDNQVEWSEDIVIREQDADQVCFQAKEFLRGKLLDRKYKLPLPGLELAGDLLIRRFAYKTRSSTEDGVVQVIVPKKIGSGRIENST